MDKNNYEYNTFENIILENAYLEDFTFADCDFLNCKISSCSIIRCSFSNCRFYGCTVTSLSAKYSQSRFSQFTDCRLVNIQWHELLPSGKLSEPISKINRCLLKYNAFTGINFRKFDFSGSEIISSIFGECHLNESLFKSCRLDGTEFYSCDLRKSDFREASGYNIDIFSNNLKGARFSFPEAVRLLDGLGIKIE